MSARRFVAVSILLLAASVMCPAQDGGLSSALSVLRSQAGSISVDMLKAIGPTYPLELQLVIEEAALPSVVENAFLETFNQRGIRIGRSELFGDGDNRLTVLVLEQRALFDSLESGLYRRTVRTVLEGRFAPAGGAALRYLGSFERMAVDTVRDRDALPWARQDVTAGQESSTFSKIIAPLVIISGAALIIYLFFAVRSF